MAGSGDRPNLRSQFATSRFRPQDFDLLGCQPEREVSRKAICVSAHLLVESLGACAVKSRQVGIQYRLEATNDETALANVSRVDQGSMYICSMLRPMRSNGHRAIIRDDKLTT